MFSKLITLALATFIVLAMSDSAFAGRRHNSGPVSIHVGNGFSDFGISVGSSRHGYRSGMWHRSPRYGHRRIRRHGRRYDNATGAIFGALFGAGIIEALRSRQPQQFYSQSQFYPEPLRIVVCKDGRWDNGVAGVACQWSDGIWRPAN